jgi:hypothetical protein
MKNKLQQIKQTWTYRNKSPIIIASLLVALYYPAYIAPYLPTLPTYAATVEYTITPPQATSTTIAAMLEQRAIELYDENKQWDLEKYRQEAIRELNTQLLGLSATSTFIDYNELAAKYPELAEKYKD